MSACGPDTENRSIVQVRRRRDWCLQKADPEGPGGAGLTYITSRSTTTESQGWVGEVPEPSGPKLSVPSTTVSFSAHLKCHWYGVRAPRLWIAAADRMGGGSSSFVNTVLARAFDFFGDAEKYILVLVGGFVMQHFVVLEKHNMEWIASLN